MWNEHGEPLKSLEAYLTIDAVNDFAPDFPVDSACVEGNFHAGHSSRWSKQPWSIADGIDNVRVGFGLGLVWAWFVLDLPGGVGL
jgi:hypothetical protein